VTRVTVVTALRPETRAVLGALARPARLAGGRCPAWRGMAGPNEVVVVQGGVGRIGAARAVSALPRDADLLVSLGFAGALAAALEPGALVLPATVLWESGGLQRYAVPPALAEDVAATLERSLGHAPERGTLLSSPVVLATPVAKRAAAARHGAVAVEMEAATLATHALECGVSLLVVRAILDPAALSLEGLPAALEASWAARARLLGRPRVWPLLATLKRHADVAASALAAAARVVLPALVVPGRR
jgi:nucleoside phosphorylase